MGAAMAPAAIDTIRQHFEDFHRRPQDYDLIVTGDLGLLGKQIVLEQLRQDGFDLAGRYNDCGVMIFDTERQDVHAGAGATVPLTGFGYNLSKGVREAVSEDGLLGALTGGLKAAAGGITAAMVFGFLAALLFDPKDKA